MTEELEEPALALTLPDTLTLKALPGIAAIQAGDDLATILGDALETLGFVAAPGDVLVVTHKIISKAEGRCVDLAEVVPSETARSLAEETGKSPAICELIIGESCRIVRKRVGLIIAEHRLGMIMANAGIDQSNVGSNVDSGSSFNGRSRADGGSSADGEDEQEWALLLPEDPDASAASLANALSARFGTTLALVVSDSVGRAWRNGVVGLALGAANLPALVDLRGKKDLDGRPLKVTQVGLADEIASAAELLMGEADEGRPAVLLQGLDFDGEPRPARALLRPHEEDLFR